MADRPEQVLRVVSDGRTWLGVGDAHPSEFLLFCLFFREADFLLGRVFFVGRERAEVTVKTALVGAAYFPLGLVLEDVQLRLSCFFLCK